MSMRNKILSSTFALTGAMMLLSACSSRKETVKTEPVAPPFVQAATVPAAPTPPANLGASSSGMGR